MLDFGFPELLVVMVVAILVIGPQEIPAVMRTLGRLVRRLNYMRFALTRQLDEFMNEGIEADDVGRQVNFSRQMSQEARAPKNADFDEQAEDEALAAEHVAEKDNADEQ